MTNEINNLFKRYKLDDTLYKIGELTRDMVVNIKGIQEAHWHRKLGRFYQSGFMYVTPWQLTGLAYELICNSNDYKSKIVKDENELLSLLSKYQQYDEVLSSERMDNVKESDILLYITFGHSQQQFWYQNLQQIIIQFNRNTEILLYIWKDINSSIDIDNIIYDKLGFDSDTFNKLLVYLLWINLKETDISSKEVYNILEEYDPSLIKDNLKKVIELYTANYEFFRKQMKLEENSLFVKPIIKTDTNKLLIVNHHLLIKLLSDGLYWIIRNHFYEKDSQDFINDFGRAFEVYLENVLKHYLNKKIYYHLPDSNKHKIADWIIETDEFFIILEQKSTIASLALKTMYPDINNLKKYINKFNEGFSQLNETEKVLKKQIGKRKIVKLIVHYENLYVQNVLKSEIQKSRNNKEEDLNIFFINIYELERLLYVLSTDINVFYEILEKMLLVSSQFSVESRDFNQIMNNLEIKQNDYLSNNRNHFDRILNELEK
ncbi:hypothetical protein HYH96_04745 [Clostridium botulinum]|uniref:hypothetical protein n=1 Tax=Clostridium botulinum TaxID=1491 RepID=UPI00174A6AFE|nr:hypothetical protein [Clostridium botulinum]MBD5643201.1 hypothetical protein [Clostridium botulinum]